MTPFTPLNELESALQQANSDRSAVQAVLRQLMEAEIAVPSAAEVLDDGSGFQPVLFPKEGVQMLACFTDSSRIGEYSKIAPYYLRMKGRDLLQRLPYGFGIVVNPGWSVGFDISPDGIERVLRDLG